jgi:uncharacterized membrane protein YfhO
VLVLNDKFDPNWRVSVDGQPQTLLRCNFIMRGVYLPAGPHTVEFQYHPSITGLYVSLSAIIVGLALCGYLAFSKAPPAPPVAPAPAAPKQKPAKVGTAKPA